jgi:hypothetical protein
VSAPVDARPCADTGVALRLAGDLVDAHWVRGVEQLSIHERTIVVNVHQEPVVIDESPRRFIPGFGSTILCNTRLARVGSVVLLRIREPAATVTATDGWRRFAELAEDFPAEIPLWRGPAAQLGDVEFDPGVVLGEKTGPMTPRRFDVRVNLWFAPAGTDCGIHNEHGFLETHTQIHGIGRMQKFTSQEHTAIYQDVILAEGNTHLPFCTTARGGFDYPWHQYHADSDCVWLAVEYHADRPQ